LAAKALPLTAFGELNYGVPRPLDFGERDGKGSKREGAKREERKERSRERDKEGQRHLNPGGMTQYIKSKIRFFPNSNFDC